MAFLEDAHYITAERGGVAGDGKRQGMVDEMTAAHEASLGA